MLSVVAVLLLATATFLAVVFSGEYNVAATTGHAPVVRWTLATVMENSVRDHAEGVRVPPLSDSTLLQSGLHHFGEMCVTCHGAPGVERSEIGKGLLPEPPELSRVVPQWTSAELFWIVKHGIKMSGMPAFGVTHDDRELWGIVAFLRRLPELSPQEYEALRQTMERAGGGGTHGHAHEH